MHEPPPIQPLTDLTAPCVQATPVSLAESLQVFYVKTEIGGCHRHFQPVTIKLQILEGRRPVFPTARSLSPMKAGRQGVISSNYLTLVENVHRPF